LLQITSAIALRRSRLYSTTASDQQIEEWTRESVKSSGPLHLAPRIDGAARETLQKLRVPRTGVRLVEERSLFARINARDIAKVQIKTAG
jgi:hypothetical protein